MSLIEINREEFEAKIREGKVVVDFYATWCGPCKQLLPILEDVNNEREDVEIYKVNADENPDLLTKFGIRSIPTVKYFSNGEEKDTTMGVIPKTTILEKIDSL